MVGRAAAIPLAGARDLKEPMSFLRVDDLYKIFGPRPESVLERARAGQRRSDIQADTGHVVAVSGVTFAVEAGEFFVIMGLSGSGKSTIIRMINRLVEPTSGRISLDDVEITALDKPELRRLRQQRISMVFQHFALFPIAPWAERRPGWR